MSAELHIRSRRIVTPEGVRPGVIIIENDLVRAVTDHAPPTSGRHRHEVDAGDAVVMPGLVDTHVHINEPGRTHWEGFSTAGQAAAAGGVTTLVDMPLNSSPVTTSPEALALKREAAQACSVDVGFWAGVVPGNADQLESLLQQGALGGKCFLVPSGIDDFPAVTEADLRPAMEVLAEAGAPLLVHAEHPGPIAAARPAPEADPRSYGTWLESRPPAAELEAIALLLRLAEETGCAVHIVHLATASALPGLASARQRGLPISVETCPHYLTFAAEDIPDRATQLKCAPPIRERAEREGLWEGLRSGTIDFIASDHSPCPQEMKHLESGDFLAAWGGIASLQLGLPAVWTEARRRGFDFDDLARWLCERPAHLAGLGARKGRLAPGYDGDIVIWNPEESFIVQPEELRHRHRLTPYSGCQLWGKVERTFLRGQCLFDRRAPTQTLHAGRRLRRDSAA